MPDATVTIVGLDELQRRLKASDAQLARALGPGLKAGALVVRTEAQRRVPVVTGKLKASIQLGPVQGSGVAKSITVGIAPGGARGGLTGQAYRGRSGAAGLATNPSRKNNVSDPRVYGPVVERGSGPHTITAKGMGKRGPKKLMFSVGGETLFRRTVNHPGTKAHPFLVPALTEHEREVTRRVLERVEEVLRSIARR